MLTTIDPAQSQVKITEDAVKLIHSLHILVGDYFKRHQTHKHHTVYASNVRLDGMHCPPGVPYIEFGQMYTGDHYWLHKKIYLISCNILLFLLVTYYKKQ